MKGKKHFVKSSGNVFEDLCLKDSGEQLAKANLVICITDIIQLRGYSQTKAAAVLGINQPKVSALVNGQLSGFSLERLIGFLIKLDQDVEILVKPHNKKCLSSHPAPRVQVQCASAA